MSPPRVVIVGGGATGLSLAFTLQERARQLGEPLSLSVLESAAHPGGHVRTMKRDGFLVEAGPNGFLNREPHTLALIEELGLGARLIEAQPAARARFIVRGGRLCRVPDGPLSLVTSNALSLRGKLRLLAEPLAAGPPIGVEETVYEFAKRRIGHEAADMLVDAAVSGISAGDSRRLSVGAVFPRMTDLEREYGSLVRAMWSRRRQRQGPSKLVSLDEGLGVLTDALADRLGPALLTGTVVRAIERSPTEWRVAVNRGEIICADEVVLAVPAHGAAHIVGGIDHGLAVALRAFGAAGVGVVALGYDAKDLPRPLDGYGYLVTRGERLATLGVVWESSIFPGRAPDGAALLRVMLGGSRRPDIVDVPDNEKLAVARRELRQVMGLAAEPRHASIFSWPHALAQYTIGHRRRCEAVSDRLRRHRGLSVCGTSYDGVSFNDAVKSGRLLAGRLADRLWRAPAEAARDALGTLLETSA